MSLDSHPAGGASESSASNPRKAKQTLYVDGGFAQIVGDKLTLLPENAKRLDELDRGKADAALASARELPMLTDVEFEGRQKANARAEMQKQLAN